MTITDAAFEPLYTDTQTAVLELVPYPSALLSVVGSLLIVRSILFHRREKLKSVYHRLMLSISILDLLASLAIVLLGVWAVPEEVTFTRFGRGTFRTCAVSGFFFNFMFGTMWYSVFLSIYFLLLVRFEVAEAKIARFMEPLAHLFSTVVSFIIGFYGIATDLFNPMPDLPGFCFLHAYPPFCGSTETSPTCQRGDNFGHAAVVPSIVNMLILLVVISVSMVAIVIKVCRTERQLRHYAMDGSNRVELSRTRETAWQGVLYIGSFIALYFPIIVLNGFVGDRRERPDTPQGTLFAFALLVKISSPLQGFFDAYIYLRKKFWKQTQEGDCFFFLRKIPLLGGWITEQAALRNTSRSHVGSSDGHATSRTRTTAPPDEPAQMKQSAAMDAESAKLEEEAQTAPLEESTQVDG